MAHTTITKPKITPYTFDHLSDRRNPKNGKPVSRWEPWKKKNIRNLSVWCSVSEHNNNVASEENMLKTNWGCGNIFRF